jgi:N-acetylneuraminic acid mutarotase
MVANAVNGKIYAMTYSYMDVYDPETDNWTRISALSQELVHPRCSCAIDDKIYVIEDSTAATTIGEGKLHIYDTTTKNWSTGATLPTFYKQSRMVATTGVHAPKQIYLVGGAIIHDIGDFDSVNATFSYDPVSDSWNSTADMPTARQSAAVAVVDDKIYAIGGATKPSESWIPTQTGAVEVYTPFGYGTVQASASPSNSPDPWLVFPDATAVIIGVAVGAAIAGTVLAVTARIINRRKHPKTTKQNKPND